METNLAHAIAISIFEPLDHTVVESFLASPPFINIAGTFNARDISHGPNLPVKPGYAFRSGSLERLEPGGIAVLQSLGIKTVFDLRSGHERGLAPEPEIPGVEIIWKPSTVVNATAAPVQAEKQEAGFSLTTMNLDMLESHKASFKAVFDHILHHPDKPFLFHCTAGKDRTGVIAALILGLAGADIAYINRDYALTRLGIEPVREFLTKKLLAGNFTMKDLDSPKMQAYSKIPPDLWNNVFLEMDRKYDGVQEYVKTELDFSDDDIAVIRRNLEG